MGRKEPGSERRKRSTPLAFTSKMPAPLPTRLVSMLRNGYDLCDLRRNGGDEDFSQA